VWCGRDGITDAPATMLKKSNMMLQREVLEKLLGLVTMLKKSISVIITQDILGVCDS